MHRCSASYTSLDSGQIYHFHDVIETTDYAIVLCISLQSSSGKVMDEALFHTWAWLKCMDKDFHIHFNQWSTTLREELS